MTQYFSLYSWIFWPTVSGYEDANLCYFEMWSVEIKLYPSDSRRDNGLLLCCDDVLLNLLDILDATDGVIDDLSR